jgi:hypothetical protein
MAKCDLSIELDQGDAIHPGGGRISGVVRIDSDQSVRCDALEVQTVWRTHGRGNVTSGIVETATVFAGQWEAGERAEYRFDLPVARWPPTYHGHYLNIDHYVEARARIPWAFDPKASVPFRMRPGAPEPTRTATRTTQIAGPAAAIFVVIAALVIMGIGMAVARAAGVWILLLFLGAPLFGGIVWFVRYFLPRYRLGQIDCRLDPERVQPGSEVQGELVITPKKNVPINAIRLEFQAREQVVSGSGSNRTTHRHTLFEQSSTLQDEITLRANQEHRFPLSVTLPEDAPYSIDLDDNELIWSTKLRVDIPRWPDWVQELPLTVLPTVDTAAAESGIAPAAATRAESGVETSRGGITFEETARHLWTLRQDPNQLQTLIDAVCGLTFDLSAWIERRLLYAGDDDPHVYEDGYAVWARYPDPDLPLVLYVPQALGDEFEQAGRDLWTGRGTIVGWDDRHGRLQIKVEPPSTDH